MPGKKPVRWLARRSVRLRVTRHQSNLGLAYAEDIRSIKGGGNSGVADWNSFHVRYRFRTSLPAGRVVKPTHPARLGEFLKTNRPGQAPCVKEEFWNFFLPEADALPLTNRPLRALPLVPGHDKVRRRGGRYPLGLAQKRY
jgi:hypothetical protein